MTGEREEELGVPIPGIILDESEWARTALKRVPDGVLEWSALFGREGRLVLDIGCGNGRFTLASALARPDCNHLAVDVLPVVVRYATRRANQRGLQHVRVAVIGGRELLRDHVAPASIGEIHCYHPQPFYIRSQVGRRLITPEFLWLAHRALRSDGLFVIQSDNPSYWRYIQEVLPHFFVVHERTEPWPDAPEGRTRREILARKMGLPVFRAEATPRQDLSVDAARALAEKLRPPVFNASKKLRELDRLERASEGPG